MRKEMYSVKEEQIIRKIIINLLEMHGQWQTTSLYFVTNQRNIERNMKSETSKA